MADSKVLFRVPEDDGPSHVETLWATSLGSDQYELDNSPFYAYAISWKDIVYAPFNEEEGFPTFQRVVAKSGNRTVRVILEPPMQVGNSSDQLLQGLVALGCSYEAANSKYVSVNIPPGVELHPICSYLIGAQVQWEHADPTYSELFADEA